MIHPDLHDFISKADEYLSRTSNGSKNQEMLARMVKLSEEVGELAGEVLAKDGDQRPEKLIDTVPENLGFKMADVIITTLLLAKSADVNIDEALRLKIAKINQRFNLN